MILYAIAAVKTGRLGLFDDLLEVAIIRVSQNLRKISAWPVFIAGIVGSLDLFEWRITPAARRLHNLVTHNIPLMPRMASNLLLSLRLCRASLNNLNLVSDGTPYRAVDNSQRNKSFCCLFCESPPP